MRNDFKIFNKEKLNKIKRKITELIKHFQYTTQLIQPNRVCIAFFLNKYRHKRSKRLLFFRIQAYALLNG